MAERTRGGGVKASPWGCLKAGPQQGGVADPWRTFLCFLLTSCQPTEVGGEGALREEEALLEHAGGGLKL